MKYVGVTIIKRLHHLKKDFRKKLIPAKWDAPTLSTFKINRPSSRMKNTKFSVNMKGFQKFTNNLRA